MMYPSSFGTMDWWMLVWAGFLLIGAVALTVLLGVTPAPPTSIDRDEPEYRDRRSLMR